MTNSCKSTWNEIKKIDLEEERVGGRRRDMLQNTKSEGKKQTTVARRRGEVEKEKKKQQEIVRKSGVATNKALPEIVKWKEMKNDARL